MEELYEIMDTELPPRISQNVHGYFHLGSQRKQKHESDYNHAKLPTRLDLCNHWDKDTVASSNFITEEGLKVMGNFVFFYAIDCKTNSGTQIKPVGINPKPRAIKASYDIGKIYVFDFPIECIFFHNQKYIFKIKHYIIPIDEKTSTIEEVDHEVLIGRPDYSEIVEDQSQNCWPKVASMKAIFEDMSN